MVLWEILRDYVPISEHWRNLSCLPQASTKPELGAAQQMQSAQNEMAISTHKQHEKEL